MNTYKNYKKDPIKFTEEVDQLLSVYFRCLFPGKKHFFSIVTSDGDSFLHDTNNDTTSLISTNSSQVVNDKDVLSKLEPFEDKISNA